MKPLTPLFADSDQSTELRADLNRVRRYRQPYGEGAGLLQLRAAMEADSLPRVDASDTASLGAANDTIAAWYSAWSVKLTLLVALGGAAGLGAVWSAAQVSVGEPATAAARSGPSPVTAATPLNAVAPARTPHERPSAALEPAREPARDDPKRADDRSRREIEQLLRMRALLQTDPAAALRLAQRSAREFPDGTLREEREALQVLALASLGEDELARRRARAFVARYPESPLLARLRPLLP